MRRLLNPAGARLWAAALLLTGLGVQDSAASGPNLLPFFKRQSLTTGLVAYWPLDSISGGTTTPDTSATTPSNTATLNGAPTTAAGKIGNGFVFTSASSQYLSVADAASLQFGTGSFSLAFWAKPSDLANKMRVLNKWDSTPATGWLLDFNADAAGANLGGAIRWRISDGPNNTALVTAGGVLTSTTTFAHIAAVADRSGGQLRLYVNGTEVAPSPMTINGNPNVSDPGVNLGMGTILNGLGAYYSGMLDDVRIYNRALTPTEVQQLSTITGLPTAATNLMATTPVPPYGVVDLT